MKPDTLLFEILFGITVSLFLIQCGSETAMEPEAPAPEAYNAPEPTPTPKPINTIPEITYADITKQAGITFLHNNGHTGKKYMPETMGGGCGFFDYDNDGDLDILFTNGRDIVPSEDTQMTTFALYKNDGAGNFTDVTAETGMDIELYGMGCAMADYDGDGDMDIFVTAAIDGQRFIRNDNGEFVDVTEEAGLTAPTWTDDKGKTIPYWSTSAAFLDYDKDGWLDLFVCNYIQWSIENDIFTSITGIGKAFTRPDLYKGLSPLLYKNNGDGTFADVSKASGIWNLDGKGLGVSVEDLNEDAWLDIVVANDAQPDFMYINNGDGTFTDMGLASGIAYGDDGRARAGMGIDIAFPLKNESSVIAVGNFSHEPVSFFVQEAEGFYIEASGRTRISRPSLLSLTFGLAFLDYDFDGWLDLVIANGHIEPDIERVEKEVSYKQPPQLFRNINGETFEDVTKEVGKEFAEPMVGRGLAYGDIDNDGDLDLLLTECGGPPRLLRNDGGANANNWIRFKLQGKAPNPDAIGSRVILQTDGKTQMRRVRTGSSYVSQNELTLSFGLGDAEKLESLTIEWHDGPVQKFTKEEMKHIQINTTHKIKL